jgi:methionyl-tRNA formyltransferase
VSWRVVIVTSVPPVAAGYTAIVRSCGHEPVAIVTPRDGGMTAAHLEQDPPDVDLVFAASRKSLARVFRGYEADLAVCTGFPWLIPAEAIDALPVGIVNGHPSLLPRYRGPFPLAWAVRNGEREVGMTYHLMDAAFDTGNVLAQKAIPLEDEWSMDELVPKLQAASIELLPRALARLAAGDRGDAQTGGDYQSHFEDAYGVVDVLHTAAEIDRQVRAWGFVPPFARTGPILERNGTKVRVVRTSLTELDGAERIDCADAPLWIAESTPFQPAP